MSADILPSLAHFLTSDVFIPSSSAIALYIGIPLSWSIFKSSVYATPACLTWAYCLTISWSESVWIPNAPDRSPNLVNWSNSDCPSNPALWSWVAIASTPIFSNGVVAANFSMSLSILLAFSWVPNKVSHFIEEVSKVAL